MIDATHATDQLLFRLGADLDHFFNAAPDGGDPKFTGDVFRRVSKDTTRPSGKEIEQISNAVEYAAKCARDGGGRCGQLFGKKSVPDSVIIERAQNMLPAVITFRYPKASAEQQADIYIRVVKETVVDVKNLHWQKILPIIVLIAAPLTAGIALVGAPLGVSATGALTGGTGFLGTQSFLYGIISTLPTTVGAGVATAGAAAALKGAPKNEKEARAVLKETFAAIKDAVKRASSPAAVVPAQIPNALTPAAVPWIPIAAAIALAVAL